MDTIRFRKSNRQKKIDRRSFKPIPNRERNENPRNRKERSKFYPTLTPCQEAAIKSLSYGKVAKEIAREKGTSINTEWKHIHNANRRIGVTKETASVRWYVEIENDIPPTVGKKRA